MGNRIPRALQPYADAVQDAVNDTGHGAFEMSAHRTGSGLVAVKVEVRTSNPTNDTRGGTENASGNQEMRAAARANLANEGYEIARVLSSWFDWGRGGMGEDAVTFHIKPRVTA